MVNTVTVAILAKDKSQTLDIYLRCIENQSFPKNRIFLYIRSNNNNDNTKEKLQEWVNRVRNLYLDVYEDYSDVTENVQNYDPHEWNGLRFRVLGKIRQNSLNFAIEKGSHYFVADCDNFISYDTLELLYKTNLPIIAPLLKSSTTYSNFHETCTPNGYFMGSDAYKFIVSHKLKQITTVDVVHCTYFIRNDIISELSYSDRTHRHEYVIFSESARLKSILQFLDCRKIYGMITFADTTEQLYRECWITKFIKQNEERQFLIISPQGGLGNKLRAMASSLAMARRLNRKCFFIWEKTNIANFQTYSKFFELSEDLIPTSEHLTPTIDKIITEWLPGDNCFEIQSSGQKRWKCENKTREQVFDEDKILIEISLRLNDITDEEMIQSYSLFFKPRGKFLKFLEKIDEIDVGIHIRRGDFLEYFPECVDKMEDLAEWINGEKFEGKSIIIFSDDKPFLQHLKLLLSDETVEIDFSGFKDWEIAFLQLLILSYKCKKIYGTMNSSFSEQTKFISGKMHYSVNLS